MQIAPSQVVRLQLSRTPALSLSMHRPGGHRPRAASRHAAPGRPALEAAASKLTGSSRFHRAYTERLPRPLRSHSSARYIAPGARSPLRVEWANFDAALLQVNLQCVPQASSVLSRALASLLEISSSILLSLVIPRAVRGAFSQFQTKLPLLGTTPSESRTDQCAFSSQPDPPTSRRPLASD